VHELLWFLSGDTNVRYLREHGVTIWTNGPMPMANWARLRRAVAQWKTQTVARSTRLRAPRPDQRDPNSRRILVNAWNVGELERMALTPCHALFQFYVRAQAVVPAVSAQRRRVPRRAFQHASYALLTHMVAQQCDWASAISSGRAATPLYVNHFEQARLQLSRSRCRCRNSSSSAANSISITDSRIRVRRLPAHPRSSTIPYEEDPLEQARDRSSKAAVTHHPHAPCAEDGELTKAESNRCTSSSARRSMVAACMRPAASAAHTHHRIRGRPHLAR